MSPSSNIISTVLAISVTYTTTTLSISVLERWVARHLHTASCVIDRVSTLEMLQTLLPWHLRKACIQGLASPSSRRTGVCSVVSIVWNVGVGTAVRGRMVAGVGWSITDGVVWSAYVGMVW